MKFKPEFSGYVKSGKLFFNDRPTFDQYISGCKDGNYKVVIKKEYSSDTVQIQKYYRAVVVPILADYFGFDSTDPNDLEEVHRDVKRELCGEPVFGRDGVERKRVPSTRKFDTYDFTMYIERVRRWAMQEYTVNIPPPDPLLKKRILEKKS